MKRCAAFFIAFLVCWSSLAQANLTLANLKFAYFGPSASTMVQSCGGFSYINGSSKSADGGVTNNVIDTTGSSLYVLTVGSSAANAGTITIGTRNLANTFIAGNIVASGTTGFSNQQFYCISPLTDPNTEFYAVSSTGGRVGLVAQAWGCTGTPVFQGQIGNGATSGVTIQGGTLTPLGTNLFVSSATYDIANSGGYTAPTLENFTFSSDAVPAQGSTNSSSALSITWTNGSSSAKAVSTMMFAATGCSVPGTPIIASQTLSGVLKNNFDGELGAEFVNNGSVPITITTISRWVVSGNSADHTLHLEDATCHDLATGIVHTLGAPANAFLKVSITPTVIAPGGTFWVKSEEVNGGDFWNDESSVTLAPDIASVFSAFNCTPNSADKCYVTVNADYHL